MRDVCGDKRTIAAIAVHVPYQLPVNIPEAVMGFLAKGDKLQPARRLTSWRVYYENFGEFRRSLALALAFSKKKLGRSFAWA